MYEGGNGAGKEIGVRRKGAGGGDSACQSTTFSSVAGDGCQVISL